MVCATSTLAAGVNLPVRRVIIKAPMVGRERLGKAQYLQMAGRAGRAGFDTKGDCITIIKAGEEERWFREMLKSDIPRCMSSLSSEESMGSFILDCVVLKLAENIEEIMTAVRYSLFYAQESPENIRKLVESSVKRLEEHYFITIEPLEQDVASGNFCCNYLKVFFWNFQKFYRPSELFTVIFSF